MRSRDKDAPRSKDGLASQRRLYIPANTEGSCITQLVYITGRFVKSVSEDEPCEEKWIRRRRGSL
jgi:hypothetical protein